MKMVIHEHLKEALSTSELGSILGQDSVKNQLKGALIAGHHVIILGPPGVGKTTLAKDVATILPPADVNDCGFNCNPNKPQCPICLSGKKVKTKKIAGEERFIRVQGSSDLTAEDLIGDIDPVKALEYGPLSLEAFTPGKIFKANNGVLFFDELNRAPEKLQNSLLQVLQEGKATIGSYDVDLNADFVFIATMNPKDVSTEKLSDVLMDRFDMIYMDYPENDDVEEDIVLTKGKKTIAFPDDLLEFSVRFVRGLREEKDLEKVPSVRASISLYERAQSNALLNGRKSVVFDDIKEVLVSVLAHRIELKPSLKYLKGAEEVIRENFEKFTAQHFPDLSGGDGL